MPPLVPMGVSPFLSTPSVRRATIIGQVLTGTTSHFYPRPPRGGRRFIFHSEVCIWKFLSTPSARRATLPLIPSPLDDVISIHALREEGDLCTFQILGSLCISIHALREEGDDRWGMAMVLASTFLSTPSARRATASSNLAGRIEGFLSTPSARRATTVLADFIQLGHEFLSTPSARRATVHAEGCSRLFQISIHALREEGDWSAGRSRHRLWNFYPRPPRGGRLRSGTIIFRPDKISIHALREEGDICFLIYAIQGFPFLSTPSARRATPQRPVFLGHTYKFLSTPSARRATCQIPQTITLLQHFYPRPPRGGRHVHKRLVSDDWEFLSTPSARRATLPAGEQAAAMGISIHALREEGDLRISDALELKTAFLSTPSARRATKNPSFDVAVRINFYPRPPRGGRRLSRLISSSRRVFLSTPSARRATGHGHYCRVPGAHFYPRPPRGGRPGGGYLMGCVAEFLSTPSARRATQLFKASCCKP